MNTNSTPNNFEFIKKINYKNNNIEVIFKIDSNDDFEVMCILESGLSFISEKLNIKTATLDYESFSTLIKEEENWKLEGEINENDFTIIIFKIIKLKLKMINTIENSEKIIKYLCKKVNEISNEINTLKNNNKDNNNEIKVIEIKLINGWSNYGSIYAPAKIIKKGNEITLSGLIKGTNFSTVCYLPEDCRPKNTLIFSLNHHNSIMRFDVGSDGAVFYQAGNKSYDWISLDGIHFFAGI